MCFAALILPLFAGEPAPTTPSGNSNSSSEIALLRQMLADQQKQIDELRRALSNQQQILEAVTHSNENDKPNRTQVASLAPIVPSIPAAPAVSAAIPAQRQSAVSAAPAGQATNTAASNSSPLQLKIGDAYITPVGFMDFTSITRDVTTGTGIGTNFGSIPYSNTAAGNLSESRLSTQNSRIGLRVDAMVKGAKVLGYLESDFLGFVPTNAAVTSNSDSLRLRLYWVNIAKSKYEFLAGQSWSMLTPSRKGIGALPGDLFYSQVIDTNYMNGLTWSRQSGVRFVYHPSSKLTFGTAIENAEQYIGGSGGGAVPTLPSTMTGLAGTEFNNGTTTLNAPQLHPDIIAKLAYDPNSKFHIEVAGIERTFKDYIAASNTSFTKVGGGAQLNIGVELAKGLRLFTNNYYSYGGGRYLFGVAPDLIVRADGSLSPIHAHSTVDGLEYTYKNTALYAYYGGIYIGRNTAIDSNGTTNIGYGYSGSPNSQNRSTNEATFGVNQTFWRDAKYGALNLMLQYAYLQRNPWFVATGAPTSASANMVWVNLRYTLPGSAPTLGR